MNYPHPFMMGQIPISQQMAMLAQQQQQQQHHQQQQQHHQMLQQHQQMPAQPPMQQQQQPQHPPPQQMPKASPAPKVTKKRTRKDPNSPKRAMSAYFMYVQKERQEMEKRGEKISKVTEFTKAVSERWRRMTPTEKEPYEQLSGKDKERYEAEMVAFTGKKKDVNKPKKPQTAYFLWLAGWREHNKDKYDHKELLRQAGLVWNQLSDVDKAPYLRAAEEEKQKYEGRMREYTAGLSTNKPASGGVTSAKQVKVEGNSSGQVQHQQPPNMTGAGMSAPQQGQMPLPGMQMQGGAMGGMSPQAMGQQGGNMNMMNYAAAAQQAAMAQQFHQMATAYYQQQQQQHMQPPQHNNHDNGDDDDDEDDDDEDDDDDDDGSE